MVVVDSGVRSYTKENVAKAIKGLNAAVEERYFALFRNQADYEKSVAKHRKEGGIDTCLAEYEVLLYDCKVKHISVSNIDGNQMLDDYFQKSCDFN